MDPVTIARAMAAGRVVFGTAFLLAPRMSARAWVGRDGARPASKVLITAVGARELALGGGLLNALGRGGGPARPWVAGAAASDLGDFVATLRARRDVPPVSAAALLVVAGTAAAVGGWLTAQEDW